MKKNVMRKSIVILLIMALLISVSVVIGHAIYTNLSGKKGIVVVDGKEVCNYSSDKLNNYPYNSDLENSLDNQIYITFAENSEKKTSFTVSNTSGKGTNIANRNDIVYKIVLNVQNSQGEDITSTSDVTVKRENEVLVFGEGGVSEQEYSLGGGTVTTHIFTVYFPENCENNIAVSIEARPLEEFKSATMNNTLFRKFIPTLNSASEYNFTCVGEFSDNTGEEGNAPENYHAYNYHITVRNGIGDITLEWDGNKLTLDEACYEKLGIAEEETQTDGNGICSVVFESNAEAIEQNYELIFYKSSGYPTEPLPAWDDMEYSGDGDLSWYVRTVGQEK